MKFGKAGHPSKTDGGEWRFAGISMLLPVYEDLEDGAEILWTNLGSLPMKSLKGMVKPKGKLPVFQDNEEA